MWFSFGISVPKVPNLWLCSTNTPLLNASWYQNFLSINLNQPVTQFSKINLPAAHSSLHWISFPHTLGSFVQAQCFLTALVLQPISQVNKKILTKLFSYLLSLDFNSWTCLKISCLKGSEQRSTCSANLSTTACKFSRVFKITDWLWQFMRDWLWSFTVFWVKGESVLAGSAILTRV